MIQSEPPITRMTIKTPKANASTLLVLSGREVEEEHEVHADLRNR